MKKAKKKQTIKKVKSGESTVNKQQLSTTNYSLFKKIPANVLNGIYEYSH